MKLTKYVALAITMCALFVLIVPAQADTAYLTIHPGDNWISAPLVPYNPAPDAVFGAVLNKSTLTRFDAATITEFDYGTNPTAFGNILLGDGYILNYTGSSAVTISYEGVPDGIPDPSGNMTDMWVSLPGRQTDRSDIGGLHWIGQPFYHSTPIEACQVTDGVRMYSLSEAVTAGLIDGLWYGLDAASQTQFTVGLSSLNPQRSYLQAGYMYQLNTHRDNLALIVPANAVPEPGCLVVVLSGVGVLVGWKRRK